MLADQAPGTGHEEKTYTEEKGGGLNVARYLLTLRRRSSSISRNTMSGLMYRNLGRLSF